jgi:hypothetical protein
MTNNNNLEQWNSTLNCQVFVKEMVQHVGLNYPSTMLTSHDLSPIIVDFSILCIRSSAVIKQKSWKEKKRNNEDGSRQGETADSVTLESLGITRNHMESADSAVLESFGITWNHMESMESHGITWNHVESLGITWNHGIIESAVSPLGSRLMRSE